MATLDEIGREKQRISQRFAQLDAERTKLSDQLNDLETAARVLKRFGGKAETTKGRRRGTRQGLRRQPLVRTEPKAASTRSACY